MAILVVDDAANQANLCKTVLEDEGYPGVNVCYSGGEAIDILNAHGKDFHLVFLDWRMDGLSGLDILRFIKNNDHTRHIHVVMITGENHPRSIQAALEDGVDDYIVKPLDIDLLLEKAKKFLGGPQA